MICIFFNGDLMKKSLYIRIFVLLIITLIIFLLSKLRFINISNLKDYANSNINLRKISEIYHYNYFNKDTLVSNSNNIIVKDVLYYDNHIDIFPLDDKVSFPLSGLIIKASKNEVLIEASNDLIYSIYNISDIRVRIYKYVAVGEILGYSNFYSIKGNNFTDLNYIENYEEI